MSCVSELESKSLDREQRIEAHRARVAEEFQSRPDAKPMEKLDIANVERLAADDQAALLRRLEISHPRLFAEMQEAADGLWGDWDDADQRWELTPHELRRVRDRQRQAV